MKDLDHTLKVLGMSMAGILDAQRETALKEGEDEDAQAFLLAAGDLITEIGSALLSGDSETKKRIIAKYEAAIDSNLGSK